MFREHAIRSFSELFLEGVHVDCGNTMTDIKGDCKTNKDCFHLILVACNEEVAHRMNVRSDSGSGACAHLLLPSNVVLLVNSRNIFPTWNLGFES